MPPADRPDLSINKIHPILSWLQCPGGVQAAWAVASMWHEVHGAPVKECGGSVFDADIWTCIV